MKIIVLFLQYDTDKYPCSFFYLQKYLSKLDAEKEVIRIYNNIEDGYAIPYEDSIRIPGDNSYWEFSGWTKGLNFVKKQGYEYDAILFVNDSFLAPSGLRSPLCIINNESLLSCVENNSIVGDKLSTEYRDIRIGRYKIEQYIRTHCFWLPYEIANNLTSLVGVHKFFLDMCIPREPIFPYFKPGPLLNGVAKRNIINNLTKHWHSRFNPDNNWDLFRMKALMLMNELVFYTRIKELSCIK